MRVAKRNPEVAPIAMIQEIDYPSLEAIEEALAFGVRIKARAVTDEFIAPFDRRSYHLVARCQVPA